MTNPAIRVEQLSKRYRIGIKDKTHDTFAGALADFATRPIRNLSRLRRLSAFRDSDEGGDDIIWALKDVTFDVVAGEVLGIIGQNGSGKTTLLRILSNITEPTGGRALINGRVSSLLEVGTGFHPELTGRENVFLNGTVLGMTRKEVDRKFDEIVDFSGVRKFIDTPLKRYSSGMQVRLAFAVAAHLEPEILLVDEVLAVGDTAFQKKCLGKMGDVVREGRTVLFVSHNMASVLRLCPRSILLHNGEMSVSGETREVINTYTSEGQMPKTDLESRRDRSGNGTIRFGSVAFHRNNGDASYTFLSGDDLLIRLTYSMTERMRQGATASVSLGFQDAYGDTLFLCGNELTGEIPDDWPPTGEIICTIPKLPLISGVYSVNLYSTVNGIVADWVTDAATFRVETADYYGTGRTPPPSHSRFFVDHSWSIG